MSLNKKKKNIVKKFRICVLGPSYVGKTQIVNRFINNGFTGYYEPTMSCEIYRRAYNLNEDAPENEPLFFDIEIWDMFPHDHPWLDEEPELMDESKREMAKQLDMVI